MENRIEKLREYLDAQINAKARGKLWFVERHMFSVSNFAAMIAMKRGMNSELATIIGLLHDIHTVLTDDPVNHAELSSVKAKAILSELEIVSDLESALICNAIRNHSMKDAIHDAYSELIKDADVWSHYLFNTTLPIIEDEKTRLDKLIKEFGWMPS